MSSLFARLLQLKCTAFSQSESSTFCYEVIRLFWVQLESTSAIKLARLKQNSNRKSFKSLKLQLLIYFKVYEKKYLISCWCITNVTEFQLCALSFNNTTEVVFLSLSSCRVWDLSKLKLTTEIRNPHWKVKNMEEKLSIILVIVSQKRHVW